jgi:predicted metal-binding membrane protein
MALRRIAPDRALLVGAALLFADRAALTAAWAASMAHMPGMQMPGGWTMSMTWMRMPGQGWAGAAASFLGMWSVMMVAMMLPAIAPALRGHATNTLRVVVAYFGIWILCGLLIYPLGVALAALTMRVPALARLVPALACVALALAGLLQLGAWKARQLECCRSARGRPVTTPGAAWRHGLALGLRCCACCAPLTAALLVLGVMDLRAMAAATLAISLERLAPRGLVAARISGAMLIGTALLLLAGGPG